MLNYRRQIKASKENSYPESFEKTCLPPLPAVIQKR